MSNKNIRLTNPDSTTLLQITSIALEVLYASGEQSGEEA
jgi:hypothetical protein